MNHHSRPLKNLDLWLISFFIFVLFYLLAYIKPHGIFWSLDEGGKYIYLQSVLKSGSVNAPLIYPGYILDSSFENLALHYYILKSGNIYTWWPVGFPLLTLPFYKLLGWMGLYFIPAVSGAVIALISGIIVRKIINRPRWVGISTVLIVGLASPISFYSLVFWEHTLAVACGMISLYLIFANYDYPKKGALLLAGVAGSLSAFFRTEMGLVIIGFGLALILLKWQRAVFYALGGVITTVLWMVMNILLMGTPISPNFSSVASSVTGFTASGIKFIPYLLFNTPTISAFSLGRNLLILGTVAVGCTLLLSLFPRTRILSIVPFVVVLIVCTYVLAQASIYRSVHGFILISPLILLSLWIYRLSCWQPYRPFWLICLGGMFVFMIGFIAKAWLAAGGLQWGPRYLLSLYPLLLIASIVGFWEVFAQSKLWVRWFALGSFLVAILVGFGFQLRGYLTMNLTMQLYDQSAQTLRSLKNDIITTDCTWMSMVIPDLYWNGNIFRGVPGDTLSENLRNAGIGSYLSIKMVACSTTYLDQVVQEYKQYPNGLIIHEQSLASP